MSVARGSRVGSRAAPSSHVTQKTTPKRLWRAGAVGYARPLHVTADHGTGSRAMRGPFFFCLPSHARTNYMY
eukprot:2085494-Prymnesium_polylepis.1